MVELEFDHPDYVSKAEKSWKVIAGALQNLLGYNVELRINLARSDLNEHGKIKKPYFGLFNCSRRVLHRKSQLSATTECASNASENSDSTPSTNITRDKYVETCSSEGGSRFSYTCCHGKVLFKTIRSNGGNALSVGANTPNGPLPAHPSDNYGININKGCSNSVAVEPQSKPRYVIGNLRRGFMFIMN